MKNEDMTGQYNFYDLDIDQDRRPCRYKFRRYIGQKVKTLHGVGVITKIEQYYTVFRLEDGRTLCGTPHDLTPLDENEREERE